MFVLKVTEAADHMSSLIFPLCHIFTSIAAGKGLLRSRRMCAVHDVAHPQLRPGEQTVHDVGPDVEMFSLDDKQALVLSRNSSEDIH